MLDPLAVDLVGDKLHQLNGQWDVHDHFRDTADATKSWFGDDSYSLVGGSCICYHFITPLRQQRRK